MPLSFKSKKYFHILTAKKSRDFSHRTKKSMKFFSRLRLRNRSNPNPNQYRNSDPNPIPNDSGDRETDGEESSHGYVVVRNADELDVDEGYHTASSSLRRGFLEVDNGVTVSRERSLETEDTASSSSASPSERRRIADDHDDSMSLIHVKASASTTMSSVATEENRNADVPPTDDCCPICFGAFVVPCKASCGHWYCGSCILQYWNYGAALQPCKCAMCSRKITNLTPEASLSEKQEVEVTEVLKNIKKYNRLFVGGIYGFILKLLELPLYVKRIFQDMMNPDRPGAHLNKLRIFAMVLGLLYTFSPFDFLRIGRQNVIDVFDYSAMAISFILYIFGLYDQRRRLQRVREMAPIQL